MKLNNIEIMRSLMFWCVATLLAYMLVLINNNALFGGLLITNSIFVVFQIIKMGLFILIDNKIIFKEIVPEEEK